MEGESQGTMLLQLIKGRWMMAVVSFYILFCSGATYIFGIYSSAIKESLHYNQETIDTLSFFKDLGANIGIIAGLMYEVLPAWTVLAVGALMNLFGYLMIWLVVTHRIAHPPTWHMYLFLCIGANSQNFASTGVLVTFVKNFPQGRGEVLGIIKGCVGLSGAIFTQIYLAIYGEDTKGVILLIAWLPSLVTLLFMFFIRPMTPTVYDKHETRNIYSFLYLALLLAAFLMVAIIVEDELHRIPSIAYKAFGTLALILVISNIIIGIRAEYAFQAQVEESISSKGKMLHELSTTAKKKVVVKDEEGKAPLEDGKLSNSHLNEEIHTWSHKKDDVKLQEGVELVTNCTSSSLKEGHLVNITKFFKKWPERGEDFTIPRAILSMDMWILFISVTCGLGTTLAAIDNMGQIGESLGYEKKSIKTFVSLISIWNFLGRVLAGFVSEILLRRYRVSRTLMLTMVLSLACIGHLLIAFPAPNTLYIASIIVGLCFGAQVPLLFSIISELFGLKYFATLHNVVAIASPLGSYLFNVRVAGHLYDREARRQHEALLSFVGAGVKGAPTLAPMYAGDLKCMGSDCFRLTFLIMAMVSAFGSLVSSLLFFRTKKFYSQDIYNKFNVKLENKENQQET